LTTSRAGGQRNHHAKKNMAAGTDPLTPKRGRGIFSSVGGYYV